MQRVVITGSTRGIGFGLAGAFLEQGGSVVVSGRTPDAVEQAIARLAEDYDPARIAGQACDVTHYDQLEALWDAAVQAFGGVDIWINNAGVGTPYRAPWEIAPEQVEQVIRTNLLGVMFGTQVAYRRMVEQGSGQIFNVEGFGSTGGMRRGMTIYGSSKAAVTYFTRSFLKEMGDGPVLLGTISPGMVATGLVTGAFDDPAEFERSRKVMSILTDRVETVAPWLVRRMLENRKNGAAIRWLTSTKVTLRFLSAPFSHRDPFD